MASRTCLPPVRCIWPVADVCRLGAVLLMPSLLFMPVGVHLAVVDPGVGSARRAVALQTADGRILIGPDNGLLWPVARLCGETAP